MDQFYQSLMEHDTTDPEWVRARWFGVGLVPLHCHEIMCLVQDVAEQQEYALKLPKSVQNVLRRQFGPSAIKEYKLSGIVAMLAPLSAGEPHIAELAAGKLEQMRKKFGLSRPAISRIAELAPLLWQQHGMNQLIVWERMLAAM